jgi:hypothetical protein
MRVLNSAKSKEKQPFVCVNKVHMYTQVNQKQLWSPVLHKRGVAGRNLGDILPRTEQPEPGASSGNIRKSLLACLTHSSKRRRLLLSSDEVHEQLLTFLSHGLLLRHALQVRKNAIIDL